MNRGRVKVDGGAIWGNSDGAPLACPAGRLEAQRLRVCHHRHGR